MWPVKGSSSRRIMVARSICVADAPGDSLRQINPGTADPSYAFC
jgi:hypothetical protein